MLCTISLLAVGPSARLLLLGSIHGTGKEWDRKQHECQGHSRRVGGAGIERRLGSETWTVESRETGTGARSGLDLVAGIRQKIEELGAEPMVDGIIDLVRAVTTQEGTAKGGDGNLGQVKEPGLVDNNIEHGVAFVAKEVASTVTHGGDALVMSELDNLSLLDFDCFLGASELATSLIMGALGAFELDVSLLGRGLGLGGGSLESGGFGSLGVGGGHGRRRSQKENWRQRNKQLKIALVCKKGITRESESVENLQRVGQETNVSCQWNVTEGRVQRVQLTCIVLMHRDGFVHAGIGVVPLKWSGSDSRVC